MNQFAQPRAHADASVAAAKRARIDERHVRPLNDMVRDINQSHGDNNAAPWFDPDDGGVNARVLFLLECPGPKSSAHKGSGLISADNNDQTAANFFLLREEAKLDRQSIVIWNIVPWYLPSTDGRSTKNASKADVAEATPWLDRLLVLLPELRLVVTMGAKARDGWMRYLTSTPDRRLLPTLAVPHPSPQRLNTDPEARTLVLNAMRSAARVARTPHVRNPAGK